jgi:hypothetical protein
MSAISSGKTEDTTSTQQAAAGTGHLPSEDEPSKGIIGLGDVALSRAEYFIDPDGVHVIRSLDFDVKAYADDKNAAVAMFVDNAEDYCSYLVDLARKGKANARELQALGLLFDRVMAVRRERERELSEDLTAALLRKVLRKAAPTPTWRQLTTPKISSEPPSG